MSASAVVRRVAVVVGNPKAASRTTLVAQAVATRLRDALGGDTTVETLELADIAAELFLPQSDRCRAAQEFVGTSTVLVAATPVYKATYTGLLKAFFDRLPTGGLSGMPCVAVMLGGSPAHSLAVEVHLRPLLAEVGGNTLPGCYVTEAELDHLDDAVDTWWTRAQTLFPVRAPNLKEMSDVGPGR
jgi:FMN reductase